MIKRTHKMLAASVVIAMLTASCSVPHQETKENLIPRVTTNFTSTLTSTSKVSEKVNTTTTTTTVTTSESTTAESTVIVTEAKPVVTEMTTLRETEEHYSPIITEPVATETQPTTTTVTYTETTTEKPVTEVISCSLTDSEYTLLCQLIANEAGFASLIERAKIVGAVMNGCKRWNKTVTEFIYSACVPYGFSPGQTYYCRGTVRASDMADAVDYYLANGELGFYDTGWWTDGADSWSGCHSDGLNHFYRA